MYHPYRALLPIALISTASFLDAQTTEEKKESENIVVMEKFVADEKADPNGVLPPPNDAFGMSKPVFEIPRSISTVSGEMVEKFNINELVDMAKFVPSTYTAFSFGIQGGLSVRGSAGDAYYRDMKRISNGPNMPTLIGASDGVDVVRGPSSSVYGAGQVGGYMNYKPKSARASTGRYMSDETGKFGVTIGSYGKKTYTGEIGGPLKVFNKRAGYYAYAQVDDSDSFYIGSYTRQQILQATLTVDLSDSLRLETGINYQNYHGTGLAGWNRVTQDLIDNGIYLAGLPARNLDTNKDGLVSFYELTAAGLGNLNVTVPASGVKPALTPADLFAIDPATAKYVHLSPRNVLLEKNAFGRDYIFFADLVADKNPDLVFRNKIFVEKQLHHKASDIAYFRSHKAFSAEERVTMEWHPKRFVPDWMTVTSVSALNARYLDTFNNTSNIDQIFNYWDLTYYSYPNRPYNFADGWDNPDLAPIASATKSQHIEAGLGTLLDITAFRKFSLTAGERLDTVYGRVYNRAGYTLSAANKYTVTPASFQKGSDKKYSLTSISASYEVFKGIRPYVTYANPRNLVPGSSGGLSSSTVTAKEILQPSELKEVGLKADLFGGKLFVAMSAFDQFRSSYNQTLDLYVNTKSKGADFEMRWVPTRNFNMSFAVDWIRRNTTPPSPTGTQVPVTTAGYDPIAAGLGRYSVTLSAAASERSYQPPQVWSMFANYALGHGFDVSLGTNFQGAFPSSGAYDIILPSAQTFSASVGYSTKKYDIRVSAKNLTDELYFQANSGSAGPIPNVGRTIEAKTVWKF